MVHRGNRWGVLWCTYRRNSLAHSVTFAEYGGGRFYGPKLLHPRSTRPFSRNLHHLHPPPSLALLD